MVGAGGVPTKSKGHSLNTNKASATTTNAHCEPKQCDQAAHRDWGHVVHAAVSLIDQCEQFVKDVPASVYATESVVMPGGTVGKHLRHLVDHYEAIIRAMGCAGTSDEVVDYDHREREVPMENSREDALRGLESLRTKVNNLRDHQPHRAMQVRVMISGAGHEATLMSSLARELAFATHHGVHHQAMMRAIAGEFGVEAAQDFGKAPSTINHESAKR